MRITLKAATALSLLLLTVNAGYIWAFASPTIFYMGNVLAHFVVGIVFVVLAAVLFARDSEVRRNRVLRLAAFLILVSVAFAGLLTYRGNILELRWALQAHVAASAAAVAVILQFVWQSVRVRGRSFRTYALLLQTAALLFVGLPVTTTLWTRAHPNPRDRIVNPLVPPLTPAHEGGGPSSPFFPSSAKTNVGGIIPANFFMDSELCGECHKDIYQQWKSSVHHFASFNNQFYRKSIEYMQSVVGTSPSKWCAGCHDHAVFFN